MNQALTRLYAAILAACFGLEVFSASVSLAWDGNSEPDVAGYRVYYSRLPTKVEVVDAGPGTSVTISNLADGFLYTFYATAYNSAGRESAPSSIVEYLVPALPTPVDLGPVHISRVALELEGLAITFPTAPGVLYLVEADDEFPSENWSPVASGVTGTGWAVTVTDSLWNRAVHRVYRIAATPRF